MIKIPFTDYIVGTKKQIGAVKEAVIRGAFMNSLESQLNGGSHRIGFDTLYMLYNNISDIKGAVKRIQNAFCRNGVKESVKFVDTKTEQKDMSTSESAEEVLNVLDRAELTFKQLTDLWERDTKVAGNAYWLILKNLSNKVIGLQPIDPRTMSIIADKYGNVKKYIQRIMGKIVNEFDPEEIIHSVLDFSTENPLLGASPIESIVWDGRAELAAATSNYMFYRNNAVPSHLMIVKKTLTEKQVEQLKDFSEREFKGTENRYKAGFIPYVEDIKTVTPTQREMQYLESRKFTTKKIAVVFGVDSFLLGYTEGVQRSNGKIIERDFYENTIRPDEVFFQELLNNKLLPAMGITDVKVKIIESTPFGKLEMLNNSRLDFMSGIITMNEARAMRSLSPSDNELGNEHFINGFIVDDLDAEAKRVRTELEQKTIEKLRSAQNLLT